MKEPFCEVYFGGWFGLIPKTINLEKIDILEDSDQTNSIAFGVRHMNYDGDYVYEANFQLCGIMLVGRH